MMERLNNSYYKLTSLFHQDGKGSVSWSLNITNVNIKINISVVITRASSHETSHEIYEFRVHSKDDGDEEYMRIDSSLIFFWTDSKRLFRGSQSNMTEEKWHWKISHFLNLFCPLCASGTTRSPILIINIRWDKKKIVLQYNAHRACYHLLS